MKKGWSIRKIDQVSFIQEGPGIRKHEYQEDGFPMINVRCVQDGYIDMSSARAANLELATTKWKHFQVEEGDILFTTSGTIGRCAIVQKHDLPLLMNTSVVRFRPIDATLDAHYLYYFLQSDGFQTPLKQLSSGTAIRNVGPTHIKTLDISIPPLDEQRKIVAILDEAFDGIDRAWANVEVNIESARELFEAQRSNLLKTNGNTWAAKTLGEVCLVERGSSPRPIKAFLTDGEDGVNWIKIGDTKVGSKYVTGTREKITKDGAKSSRAVFVGDFILTNSMTYGRPYIMAIDGYIHDGWFVLRLKSEVDSNFFFHLLSSRIVQGQFETLAAGSVVKNISSDLVKKAVFALPPLDTQIVIASQLDDLSTDIERVESDYRKKLQSLSHLRQSLLQKAFAGELT